MALTEQLNTYAHPTTAKRGAHFSLVSLEIEGLLSAFAGLAKVGKGHSSVRQLAGVERLLSKSFLSCLVVHFFIL